MRYPWRDKCGKPINVDDIVIDVNTNMAGMVALDDMGVPCIHLTHKLKYYWEPLDNKGPKEAYIRPLFDTSKSRFYWYRHSYVINNIRKGDKNELECK